MPMHYQNGLVKYCNNLHENNCNYTLNILGVL